MYAHAAAQNVESHNDAAAVWLGINLPVWHWENCNCRLIIEIDNKSLMPPL